jgi:hypothetical protein
MVPRGSFIVARDSGVTLAGEVTSGAWVAACMDTMKRRCSVGLVLHCESGSGTDRWAWPKNLNFSISSLRVGFCKLTKQPLQNSKRYQFLWVAE